LSQKEQQAIIEAFKRGGYNTLVATSIGEEGLDIGEVDLIVSYDHTNSSRTVQRMGRTGRARSGRCVVLASEGAEANSFRSTLDESKRVFQFLRNTKPGSRVEFCKPDSNPVGRLLPAGIIPQVPCPCC
jgi:ERCC4-related helicase